MQVDYTGQRWSIAFVQYHLLQISYLEINIRDHLEGSLDDIKFFGIVKSIRTPYNISTIYFFPTITSPQFLLRTSSQFLTLLYVHTRIQKPHPFRKKQTHWHENQFKNTKVFLSEGNAECRTSQHSPLQFFSQRKPQEHFAKRCRPTVCNLQWSISYCGHVRSMLTKRKPVTGLCYDRDVS
jgi:hypothetical protein